jgi:hypothetical protein
LDSDVDLLCVVDEGLAFSAKVLFAQHDSLVWDMYFGLPN